MNVRGNYTTIQDKEDLIKQKSLTKIFNKLNRKSKYTVKALRDNDGKLSRNVGGVNSVTDFFAKGLGFGVKRIDSFTNADIEKNEAYQNYKATLKEQGYSLEILSTKGSKLSTGDRALSGLLNSTSALFLNPYWLYISHGFSLFPASICALFGGIIYSDMKQAKFELKIKDTAIKPQESTSISAEEQAEADELLNDLNAQPVKQKESLAIIK